MKEEYPKLELTIIDLLNDSMRKGANDPENYPTVQIIAESMGIDNNTLNWWSVNDREFQEGLNRVKEAHENDPWKDTEDDEIKLDAATLSFGVSIVLEETKKRYTV